MHAVTYAPPAGACSGVFIDHLRVAFREPAESVEPVLLELFASHWADPDTPWEPDEVEFVRSDRAGNFAEVRSWSIRGLPLFRMLPAGRTTQGVGHFIIDGTNCRLVHPSFWAEIAEVGQCRAWAVKRVDAAADDDSGILNVDTLEEAYDLGHLSHDQGAPRLLDVRDPRRGTASTGWTVYVGDRKGASFVRFYLKRAEVAYRLGESAAEGVPALRVRCELERKATKGSAPIPWLMVADPAPFFAADCPLLAERAGGVEPVKVGRVVRDQREAELWALLSHCRRSYGAAIEQAFWALGGDEDGRRVLLDALRLPGSKPPVPGVSEVAGGARPDHEYMGHL